jgi:hypothetical protein
MAASACGGPYCSASVSALGHPPSGLGFECAGLDSVIRLDDTWSSVAAQHLGLPPVGRGCPHGQCGCSVCCRPEASGNRTPSQWGGWPQLHRLGRTM